MALLQYILKNFGPLVVFYVANYFCGLKPAIAIVAAGTLLMVGFYIFKRQKMTSFLKFSIAMTLVFSLVDLLLENPIFFKYEAALTNFVTAGFFAASLWTDKTFIQEFVEKRANGMEMTKERIQRCRWLTMIWVIYFVAKAAAYFGVARTYSINDALIIRTIYGTLSFYILLGWSIFLSRPTFELIQKRLQKLRGS